MSNEFTPYFMQSVMNRGNAGDGDACFDVAEYYYAQKKPEEAFHWYKKTTECDNPNPNAYFNLGYAYQYGEGTEIDMFASFEAYQKAAEQGLPQAMNNLAYFYEAGIVVPRDQDKADELCREATYVLNNLQTELFKTKRAHTELAHQNADLKKRVEDEKAAASKALEQTKAALEDVKVLQDKLAAAAQEQQKLQKRNDEAGGQLLNAKKQAEAATQTEAHLKQEIARMQKTLQQTEQDKKNLQHDFAQSKEQLASVKKDMDDAAQTEAELRQALVQKTRRVQTLEENGRQLEKKNTAQNQTVQEKNKEIENLKNQVMEKQNLVADTQRESTKTLKRWKRKYTFAVWSLWLLILILGSCMGVFWSDLEDMERKYDNLDDQYYSLNREYKALSEDYKNLSANFAQYQALVENNGLDQLYRIQLYDVYNADKNREKVDDYLKRDTLERLMFDITISSPKETGKWEDLIQIDLIGPDGSVIKEKGETHTWTLDSTDKDDTQESLRWWMWKLGEDITQAGTYQYVVYHNDYVVFRQEITIE